MTPRTSGTSNAFKGRRAVAVLGLAAGCLVASSRTVMAQSGQGDHQPGLVGTWTVQVTPRNCDTNAALGASFNSLETFHRGGTTSGSTASLTFAPSQRTAEHGTWSHQTERTYAHHFAALIVFDSASNLPGTPNFDPSLP